MEYTREFNLEKRASPAREELLAKMDGSPHDNLYPMKIGFKTLTLLRKPPTLVKAIRRLRSDEAVLSDYEGSNVTPRAFKICDLPFTPNHQSLLATNDGTRIIALTLGRNRSFPIRDMDADHLWYVYEGSGTCFTDLGPFPYRAGDLVYVPRLILSHFAPNNPTRLVGIQSEKGLRLPSSRPYDNIEIPFDECALQVPMPDVIEAPDVRTVHVRRGGVWSEVEYAYSPFQCVAWKGKLYPFAIHTSKLNFASTQSVHPDPSNFTVFASPDASAVVSVLGPRREHSLPYHHLNEWDEVLFMARRYGARKGSSGGVGDSGTMTLHPQGVFHGPQMAAVENWKRPESPEQHPWVNDLAIMFETRAPLCLCKDAEPILIEGYEKSWFESWKEYQSRHPTVMGGVGGWGGW